MKLLKFSLFIIRHSYYHGEYCLVKLSGVRSPLNDCFLIGVKHINTSIIDCGSSVSRHYLNDVHCPVCAKRDSFYSSTQAATIKSKSRKLAELKRKPLQKIKAPGICHVVGGWCASWSAVVIAAWKKRFLMAVSPGIHFPSNGSLSLIRGFSNTNAWMWSQYWVS